MSLRENLRVRLPFLCVLAVLVTATALFVRRAGAGQEVEAGSRSAAASV